ncbi:MAG: PorT family protein [Bacteroidetes bacterium]|nr:PorT family protein [Bacteroidota bacterium]
MKKHFFVITAMMIVLSCIVTDRAYAGGIGGPGIKAGMNITTLGNQDEDFSNARARFRLGGTGGFSYEWATPGTFAFDVEAMYSLRGARHKFENGGVELVAKDYLHYINFPMSLKFYIGDVFNVHFGGYVGVAVAGKRKIEGEIDIGGIHFDEDVNMFSEDMQDFRGNDYMNRLDGGVHAGAEFVGEKGIGVGARASIGLADITNDDHILGDERASTAEISIYAIFRIGN